MTKQIKTLDDLRGLSPCSLDWDDLNGGERVRYCSVCSESVINLSALTRIDAENLLNDSKVGCVRIEFQEDKTPVFKKQKSFKWQTFRLLSGVWASMFLAFGSGCSETIRTTSNTDVTKDLQKHTKQHNQVKESLIKNDGTRQVLPIKNSQNHEILKDEERKERKVYMGGISSETNESLNNNGKLELFMLLHENGVPMNH